MGTVIHPTEAAPGKVSAPPRVPPAVYLNRVYRPDREYVDGLIKTRNLGEIDHATLQRILLFALAAFEEAENVFALQECRVQASATRWRVPDVCLIPADRIPERIIVEAPLLCVEVLSPRDSLKRMRDRCMDFIAMGVPVIWIFNPEEQTAWVMTEGDLKEQKSGILQVPGTGVEVVVEALFEAARKKRRHQQ